MTFKVIWFLMVVVNQQELTSQMFQTRADCEAVAKYYRHNDLVARCTDDLEEAWEGISGRLR